MKIAFYHANCCDGLFGAYAIWKKFRGKVLLIPIDYSRTQKQTIDEFITYYLIENFERNKRFSSFAYELIDVSSSVKNIDIFFIDIAPDLEKLEILMTMFSSVTVLDHHKTAKDKYLEKFGQYSTAKSDRFALSHMSFKNAKIIFADDCCGSMLAELYFFGETQYYNDLVNDYDMWIKKIPESDYFVSGIMSLNVKSINTLHEALKNGIHFIIEKGQLIQTVRERRTGSCCSRIVPVKISYQGKIYNAGLVNSELDISSILGNTVVTKHNYDIGIAYIIKSPTEVGFSVRSADSVDSTFISKHYGGGGHKCSSGFGATLETLTKVLSTQVWELDH